MFHNQQDALGDNCIVQQNMQKINTFLLFSIQNKKICIIFEKGEANKPSYCTKRIFTGSKGKNRLFAGIAALSCTL
jgi:hypothetical protein